MKEKKQKEASTAFKWFHATSLSGGAMIISAIIASYFSVFMTDTMMLPAAACSVIMFIATLWDAINDPMMGVIADRTHTKWGKYRPYFLPAPLLLMLFSTLIWVNPPFGNTGKIIWVLITYIGWGMTVTMYTMPHMAVLPACVKGDKERNTIVTMGAAVTAIAFTVGNTFTVQIKAACENIFHVKNGYIPMMIIFSALACISFWGLFATSKEKYIKPQETKSSTALRTVLKHKELLPFILVWIMASMGYGLMFASSIYYIMYYICRPDQIPVYMGIVSIGALLSMVVFMPIALKIFKSGHAALKWTQVISIICYAVLFIFGKKHLTFLYVMTFITTAIASMSNALTVVLVNDAIDYIQLKEGFSANGIISSIKGFAQKCGTTVVSSGILGLLAASGYIANAVGQQPQSALFAINFLRFGVPCVTGIILVICMQFNPIEKCRPEIEEMKKQMNAEEVE